MSLTAAALAGEFSSTSTTSGAPSLNIHIHYDDVEFFESKF